MVFRGGPILLVAWCAMCVIAAFAQDAPATGETAATPPADGPLLRDLFDATLLERLLVPGAAAAPARARVGAGARAGDGELPASSLAIVFTNRGRVLTDAERAKFYLHPAGKRDVLVAWGHAARTAQFPGGTYDVVIRYEHDAIEREIEHRDVELVGDFVHDVAFEVVEATLTIEVTNGGRAIDPYAGAYTVRSRGQRGAALARKRPGETVTVEPGSYDVEIRYRDSEGLKTSLLENRRVEGRQFESVEIGVPLAQLSVTLTRDGQRLSPDEGKWRLYEPGQRGAWLAERGSGELLGTEAGTYDVGAFVEHDGVTTERWLVRLEVAGERHERIDMGLPRSPLQVEVTRDGRLAPEAWCTVYPAGNREAAIVSAPSGGSVELEQGVYDIGCFLREGGIRADRWIEQRSVAGPDRITLALDARPAWLRVLPRGTGGDRGTAARPRLLVIVDSSAGLRARSGTRSRMEIVRPALEEVLRDVAAVGVDLGLRVYGAALGGERDCADSQLLVAPTGYDRDALTSALDRLQPNGRAPLAYSLEQAASDLPAGEGGSAVVIAGGGEGCGGDPCRVAAGLVREGKVDRISVIAFGVDRDRMRDLDCIGQYFVTNTAGELKSALREIMRGARRDGAGRIAIFDAETGAWVADGFLGDKIQVREGRYDVVIRTAGEKTYEWTDIPISGNLEVVAGRRPPVTPQEPSE